MSGGICKIKGKERGPWFEIKCIKENILSKESKGLDANFERELLKAWSKYDGYETAKQVPKECANASGH